MHTHIRVCIRATAFPPTVCNIAYVYVHKYGINIESRIREQTYELIQMYYIACICIYIYIHAHSHTHTYIFLRMRNMHIYIRTYTGIFPESRSFQNFETHRHMHTYVTHVHIYSRSLEAFKISGQTHSYTYTNIHIFSESRNFQNLAANFNYILHTNMYTHIPSRV
jgi:hypothetical protein